MKQIGTAIGVNESRVSQLHARAIRRLRDALGRMSVEHVADMRAALVAFASKKPKMLKAELPAHNEERLASPQAVVLQYKPATKRQLAARATLKLARQRHAVAAAR